MIKFEFNNKNNMSNMDVKDSTGLDVLKAVTSVGYNISQFAKDNIESDLIEQFKKDAIECFLKGLELNEKSEDDTKRAIEKVIEKLAEIVCKEEL